MTKTNTPHIVPSLGRLWKSCANWNCSDEVLGMRPGYIEHQLAHAVRDSNGRGYNRTVRLPERCKMMQQWADYLDKLRAGAEVVLLLQRA